MSRRSQRATEYVHCPFCGSKQSSRTIVQHTEVCMAQLEKLKESKRAKTELNKSRSTTSSSTSTLNAGAWSAFVPGPRSRSPYMEGRGRGNKRGFDSWTIDNEAEKESANVPPRLEKFCMTQDQKVSSLPDSELTKSYTGPQITVMLKEAQENAANQQRLDAASAIASTSASSNPKPPPKKPDEAKKKAKLDLRREYDQKNESAQSQMKLMAQLNQLQQQGINGMGAMDWAYQRQLELQQVQQSLMLNSGYFDQQQLMAQQMAQQMYGRQIVGMQAVMNPAVLAQQQQQLIQQQAAVARQQAVELAAQQQAAAQAAKTQQVLAAQQQVAAAKIADPNQQQQHQEAIVDGTNETDENSTDGAEEKQQEPPQKQTEVEQAVTSAQQENSEQEKPPASQEQQQEAAAPPSHNPDSTTTSEGSSPQPPAPAVAEKLPTKPSSTNQPLTQDEEAKRATASTKSKAACLIYVKEVQNHPTFKEYSEFAQILKDYKTNQTPSSEVARLVGELMKDFPDLQEGFKAFMPELGRNAVGQTVGEASGEPKKKDVGDSGNVDAEKKVEGGGVEKQPQQQRQILHQQLMQQQQQQQQMLQQQQVMQQQQFSMQPGYNHMIQQQMLQQQHAQQLLLQQQHQQQQQRTAQQQQILAAQQHQLQQQLQVLAVAAQVLQATQVQQPQQTKSPHTPIANPPPSAYQLQQPQTAQVLVKRTPEQKRSSAIDLLQSYKSRLSEEMFTSLLTVLHKASQSQEPEELMKKARELLGAEGGDFDKFLGGGLGEI
ncbi:hypothetical protein TrLO_g6783 [Triparma laevis f. longispina]|uniref:Uncharacterized protein n=1 Tax=Triparma laevis f. longispina TaxID=1714387 RepID=A0A9W7FK59_9STRA|nr:hypothetical protein TrLO_g6783 [Triparma laevis f. longispina]